MPWRVETNTRLVHDGPPDKSICKIHLLDDTTLVCTDDWPRYPRYSLKLHPDFMPPEIEQLIDEAFEAFKKRERDGARTQRSDIAATVTSEVVLGAPTVEIKIGHPYGKNWVRTFTYPSPVLRLSGSSI